MGKKKLILINLLIIASTLIFAFGLTSCSETAQTDFEFEECDNGYRLTAYNGTSKEVTIPSEYKGKPVTSIDNDIFSGRSFLTGITIPGCITSIEYSSFAYCENLTNVTISTGVKSIENDAFQGCSSLTRITIPSSITSIDDYAFEGCNRLENVTLQEGLTSIGNTTFKTAKN